MKPARCSPWHDALRFRYEAGAMISRLAFEYDTTRDQMILWLRQAGTKFRVTPQLSHYPRKKKGKARAK